MQAIIQDIRYALRQLRKSPGFTLTAIVTLALGIGANTAIFTLIQGILLRSLPVTDPARLYRIGDTDDCCVDGGFPGDAATNGDFSIFSTIFFCTLKTPRRSLSNWPQCRPANGSGVCGAAMRCPNRCAANSSPAITFPHWALALMRGACSATVMTPPHRSPQRC
jgi:hypothetical protein